MGWFSCAAEVASRRNRARRSGSRAYRLGKDLHGHLALEGCIVCEEHGAHTTGTELVDDLIVAYLLSLVHNNDSPSHAVWMYCRA